MFLTRNISTLSQAAANSGTGLAVDTGNLVFDFRAENYSGSGNWIDSENGNQHIFPTLVATSFDSTNKFFYFNGSSGGGLSGSLTGISTSDTAITLEAWVKFRSSDYTSDVYGGLVGFMRQSSTQAGQGIGFDRRTLNNVTKHYFRSYEHLSDGYRYNSGNSPLQTDTWYHIVSTHDANLGKQYINGSASLNGYSQLKYTPPAHIGGISLTIGGDSYLASGNASAMKFEIGQLRAYKKKLSDAEVLLNFQNTNNNGYYNN